jgi:hypothetical protein
MAEATCAHEGCNCKPELDGTYCSDYCRRHGTHEGHEPHECNCGHPGCH